MLIKQLAIELKNSFKDFYVAKSSFSRHPFIEEYKFLLI